MTSRLVPRSPSGLPDRIGRYQIVDQLGKGAMGVVYRARDNQLDREVALKVMMTDLESEPETRARFSREAQITGRLQHRNIVTIFDMGEEDGRYFIVMELLKGKTLDERLKEPEYEPLEPKLDLMLQTCDGLSVAHAAGVTHRDIKPGNLFVLSDGSLKILDFGVARLTTSSMTRTGLIIGTPGYMSPEQARGKEVDARSDIFSAAAVFYSMLTGRKPFEGSDLPVVLQKVVREDPLPIRDSEAPDALARIVMRGMRKSPDERYQRFSEMATDLLRFKRQFDADTRQIAIAVKERFDEVLNVAGALRNARAALDAPDPGGAKEMEAQLRSRCPFLFVGKDDESPVAVPLRRNQLSAVHSDLEAMLSPMTKELAGLHRAFDAVQAGERALELNDGRTAMSHFSQAQNDLGPERGPESARIRAGVVRARELIRQQQAHDDRVRELLGAARAAEAGGDWRVVSDHCRELLALDPRLQEAVTLARRASEAITIEAQNRAKRVEKLVTQATSAMEGGRLDLADQLLRDARGISTESASLDALEKRLNEAHAAAAVAGELARLAGEAIAAARATFSAGAVDAAIEQLQTFASDHANAPGVAVELQRLRADASRLAAEAARQARARLHAIEAETLLKSGRTADALKAAELALSLDRAQEVALRIRGLAQARLRVEAEAAARSAEAEVFVTKAVEQLAAGRFDRAAEEAQRALNLDAGHANAARILADSRRLAASAKAAEQREAAGREREQQIQKKLKAIRSSLRSGDYQRAVSEAESALAIQADQPAAQQLLAQAKAALAARPPAQQSAVEPAAVNRPAFDPEDTVAARQRGGVMTALATTVGDWASGLRRRLKSPRG